MEPVEHHHAEDSAIVGLLTECQLPLRLYVRALMPGDSTFGDVIQQANAKIWEKREEFETGTNFKAWAMAIARYEVLNHRKRQARDGRLRFSGELEEIVATELVDLNDDLAERQEALRECMKSLKPESRELLMRRYASREPLSDFATRLGRSVGGVKVTLHRLRTSLAECIERRLISEGRIRMTPDEQSSLLDALLDGEISEADFLRLEAELSVDAEVRQAYYRRLQMESLLEQVASEVSLDPIAATPTGSHASIGRGFWLTGFLIAVAAGVIGIVALVPWVGNSNDANSVVARAGGDEPSAAGFAVLGGQSDAVWEGETIGNGALLPEGELHLVSGLVHVELFSGVQMMIQGDAVFSIDSPMQVSIRRGRARAHVPDPAHGFRIKTNGGDIVDLGTEFTIDVDQNRSRVKVVDGEVEVRPREADVRRIRDGEGLRLSSQGMLAKDATGEIDLVGPAAFQDALARRQSDQFRTWQQSTETLRKDPRLIAHYLVDPDQGWSRRIANGASTQNKTTGDAGDGAVVVAERTEDRWGRNGGALDFSRMGSRVRVMVPGEHRGLTLLCWVKINSLDRWYNSLFLTDGHEGREPHWQIMDDGRMFFSVKPPSTEGLSESELKQQKFLSEPFWDTSMSGQWIMLCTVYDVDQKQVKHYVNGEVISEESIPDSLLVDSIKIGAASICNWSEPMYRTDATFVVRNLNGSVDEFALFSGALSSDEISILFQAGNPNEQ